MSHDIVALGDVCEFLDSKRVPITASDRKPGPYPYYGANGQQDSVDDYIFDEPLVLLAEDGGYFGSKDRPIAYKVTGKCWVNNHAHVLRPKSNIDVDYLHRVLSYYDVTKYVNGTTRQKLTKGSAEDISFPLPPLDEQKRIASLLARADRLRQLRRAAHHLADSLLQSVFLEMFGDPEENSKGFDVFELGEIVEINPSGRTKANAEQPTSFLPMTLVEPGNIFSNVLDVKRFDEISTGYTYFEENDVLFAKITPCMENGNIVIAKNLLNGFGFGSTEFHVIRQNERANAFWLHGLVSRPEFREKATHWFRGTAGQQRVPSDFLESYRVPLPPLSLQEEFAGVVARVEALRARMSEAERQAQGLFESLLHEAFSG